MILHAENVLNDIKEQSSLLKDVKRKILNVTNSLGLSNTLIRLIEKRNTSDKYVLYAGMFITCVIMFLVWKFLA
jgi:Golgi SNAP receptor complex protein 2